MKILIVSENQNFINFFLTSKSKNETYNFVHLKEYTTAIKQAENNDLLIIDINVLNLSKFSVKNASSIYQTLCIDENQLNNIKQFLSLSFDAIITRNEDVHLIDNLIKSAKANRKYYSNEILNIIINDFQKLEDDNEKAINLFTKKELETLYFICKGFSNIEVSRKMNLSINTIKSHKKNLFKKAQVKSNAELISLSIQNGWVEF